MNSFEWIYSVEFNEETTLLFFFFTALVCVQVFFYLYFFARLILYKKPPLSDQPIDASIALIPHTISSDAIHHSASHFLNQELPQGSNLEIVLPIYIHPDSEPINPNLVPNKSAHRLLVVPLYQSAKYISGDKYPISIAIKSAHHNAIIHTRTNCTASSNKWAQIIASHLREGIDIVLGYTKLKAQASFFNKFIRFENAHSAFFFLSFALAKTPLSGNGHNLAYTKTLFHQHKGFTNFNKILGGEDNLFIHQTAHSNNTAVVLDKAAFITNEENISPNKWWHQKRIFIGTLKHYKFPHLFLLALYTLTQVLFPLAVAGFLISPYRNFTPILSLIIGRYILQWLVFGGALKRLQEIDLIKWIPIMDLLLAGYYLRAFPLFLWSSRNNANES